MNPQIEPRWRLWALDLRYAVSALLASPRHFVPAVVSMALGVGAATAVLAVFTAATLRPLPFAEEGMLVEVRLERGGDPDRTMPLSVPFLEELRALPATFQTLSAYRQTGATVTGVGEPRHVSLTTVTPEFFDTLGVTAVVGRTFRQGGPDPDPEDVAVLRRGFARAAFGGDGVLGRTVLVNGAPYTVVGVVEDERALPDDTDLWTPARFTQEQKTNRWDCGLDAVGRLRRGSSLEAAGRALADASARDPRRNPTGEVVQGRVTSLRDKLLGRTSAVAASMLGGVAVFLVLSCTNVASLLLTRASVRARELAIRSALGAPALALVRQAVLEAAVLAVAGCAGGLALAWLAIRGAVGTYREVFAYAPPRLDARVMLAFACVSAVSAVAVGALPALRARRVSPMDALRAVGQRAGGGAGRRAREALIAIQVAATVLLLVGAGLLGRSIERLNHVDPGFRPEGVVVARVTLPGERYARGDRIRRFALDLVERLRALPGVRSAAVASSFPMGHDNDRTGIEIDGGVQVNKTYAQERHVGPDYFRTLGVGVLAGRSFEPRDDKTAPRVALVNRAFAEALASGSGAAGVGGAIGRRIWAGDVTMEDARIWIEIVGVVENSLDFGLDARPKPTFFLPFAQAPRPPTPDEVPQIAIMVRGEGGDGPLLEAVPRVVRDIDGDVPVYQLATMSQVLRDSLAERALLERLLAVFGVASILLAGIGLYGVTSYSVAQRTPEIGVRRALGASAPAIIAMVLRETAVVVATGGAIGMGLSFYAAGALRSFIFGVTSADPPTYAAVVAGVLVMGLASALAPATLASRVAPRVALDGE